MLSYRMLAIIYFWRVQQLYNSSGIAEIAAAAAAVAVLCCMCQGMPV